MIKAIVFDLDDTLIQNSVHYNKTKKEFVALMEDCGFDPVRADLLSEQKDKELLQKKGWGWMRYLEALKETYQELAEKKDKTPEKDIFKKIDNLVKKEFKGEIFLVPNAVETLLELKKDFKIILLTLGDEKLQMDKVRRAGIAEYFNDIVIVEDKDSETLKTFLMISKLAPHEAVIVGNSLKHDILPAKANDVRAIFYKHKEYLKFEKINYNLFPTDVPMINDIYDTISIIKKWAE